MANYTITYNYIVKNEDGIGPRVALSSASISNPSYSPTEQSKTGISALGNVKIGPGDTATLSFANVGDNDWNLHEVQLSSEESAWGGSRGNPALNETAAGDFPGVNAQTGIVSLASSSASSIDIVDNNASEAVVYYRVGFVSGGATVYTDPRVRDSGGLD